ncbi:MAG: universal stress protein [Geminicoccaceae bacterium]
MYAHILVAVDPDTATSYSEALPQAVGLARAHGATLHVLTVVPDFGSSWVAGFFPADFEKKALAQAEKALQQLISSHVPADLPHQLVVAHGRILQGGLPRRGGGRGRSDRHGLAQADGAGPADRAQRPAGAAAYVGFGADRPLGRCHRAGAAAGRCPPERPGNERIDRDHEYAPPQECRKRAVVPPLVAQFIAARGAVSFQRMA